MIEMIFKLTFFALFLTGAAMLTAGQETKTREASDISIPKPPQQQASWLPPAADSQLPPNLITATARLFEQGLADPRGLQYRDIEIVAWRGWPRDLSVKTHGWVLPISGSNQRFAVTWNGLVYPVLSIGEEANLGADIETAIKQDEDNRAKYVATSPLKYYRFRHAVPHTNSLSATVLLPIKTCLLLRLGQTDLAAAVWKTWTAGMDEQVNDDRVHLTDPYLMLAGDWIWAIYDRAVTSHMFGGHEMALMSALMTQAFEKSVRAEIPSRPALRSWPSTQWYLSFLTPLPSLIEDEERRVNHPPASPAHWDPSTLRQRSTAELIDHLDEALAMQNSYPGGISMSDDPVVLELISRGKPAIEPLLAALESDNRLTRSVRSSRPWHYDRHFMTVYETALQAVRAILGIGNDDLQDWENIEKGIEGRRGVAARLRAVAGK
jgi:hypothetical protein